MKKIEETLEPQGFMFQGGGCRDEPFDGAAARILRDLGRCEKVLFDGWCPIWELAGSLESV